MNNSRILAYAAIGFAIFITILSATFIVKETEQVIITQFGKPVGSAIVTSGMHFKVPFIQKANSFERRFLEWNGDPNQVPTKDKRFIWVDAYARWRIHDPLLFFQRVRDERGAQSRLDDILDGETRNAIAKHNLVEVIRSTNRESQADEELTVTEGDSLLTKIQYGREKVTRSIIAVAAPRTLELGIELLDLRFKRINYVEEVQRKIYERMISERKRIAEKYRSEGQGEASRIIGDRERDLKKVQSEAYKTAQEIIGKADAEATTIYASAYNRSPESREFYRFIKTMETYKTTLSDKDWLVLSTKGDFFGYLQSQNAR
ncbi:MAG: HflC protein [Candidatus Raymondbacteria bacterium RifOxyC12_full_50_8]|uniref:Protein HflC n=1 Tax=Candidatus Raymondbacteria bacterium RIFOXYD12_FULL_49_13 TaxID=1817890 RepID=A0A1F7F6E8_UNCRA|nr:MAG: HflC protein [Candidatus Raymondbacteria bacterium RIFOXYA2_FULL_49_16]OGJ95729.1 MAG: HflC protein [Candidatus Raymondbacteria bacterium RifOxyC12_full_50_8]OGJ96031.1 MAG: HflC protein [Candidatus Raymondbacteria bacterium RifOxyB12_full_50_8]OGK02219.1 MAG: HflC protein [Candidatus Raymondbacteria bacterium RIFOXYD12_FULL_49_13]OGP45168.1 MAG: HflC protein [Candidatus Raymondbacteria bacterium RIFOXYB2_FULL_49_35]